ncbi:MAG: tRNA lysidine(34) synthetase TilS [Verrucomicrobiales bacterium]
MSQSELIQKLASLGDRFPLGQKYLIAVSGGRDSVALLDALVAIGYQKLVICHLNHQLRGRNSSADARFVAALGKRYGLAVDSGRTDVRRLARQDQRSMETAARLARHRFFAAAAVRHRCRKIFLAHHADDQVESVLMHLFRGSGLKGLCGMDEQSAMPPPPGSTARSPIQLIRPMLGISRSAIDAYISEHSLQWREDASNESSEHLRNRVRSALIPELQETFQRDIRPIVQRLAEIVSEDEHYLSDVADQALADLTIDSINLPASKLRSLHPALQRRVLQKWFAAQKIADVGFLEIESTRQLLITTSPAKINLPNNRHVRRRAGLIFVE